MPVVKGHDNVFVDCGFSAAEAENLRLRADMILALRAHLEKAKLSRIEAAKSLSTSTRRVDDIRHGRIENLSAGDLLEMLTHAGLRIELKIKGPKPRSAA
jgi:predicted XRE-type DNA-binding protein